MESKLTIPFIYGIGGNPLYTPENSLPSYWCAIGSGADGLAIEVQKTKDNQIICWNTQTIEVQNDSNCSISDMNMNDLSAIDIGQNFNSITLDNDNQPNGEFGKDKPWKKSNLKTDDLNISLLSDVLVLFARRTNIIIILKDNQLYFLDDLLELINQFGLATRVQLLFSYKILRKIHSKIKKHRTIIKCESKKDLLSFLDESIDSYSKRIFFNWENLFISTKNGYKVNGELELLINNYNLRIYLGSDYMEIAPSKKYIDSISNYNFIEGILTKAVQQTITDIKSNSIIISDAFYGQNINFNLWSAGYSHINEDTIIKQDNGLHIIIKEGGEYSGAAALCRIPIIGNFDAQVKFCVSNPQQGTTFEMAAICIDPGTTHIDNTNLNTKNINLTFDVHGSPPYASSECDEDNGFRIGWNNSFNLTRIDSDWSSISANMYNKYGRNVGQNINKCGKGFLRLIRNGNVFTSFYKDDFNPNWVCSGAALLQNISDNIFIRLAGKHWPKDNNTPPANHITFTEFKLFQS